jgi:N-acetylglucosaminyldiphosphoundecaprenol N-acetyl-beta-D-mannosaminyltransferase
MGLALRHQQSLPRPNVRVGAIQIESVAIEEAARAIIDYCGSEERRLANRPLYSTSINGQVLSLCQRDRRLSDSIVSADIVNADGQPLVLLSRIFCPTPLPERVATTDLFPAVAELAARAGVTFYFLGATEEINQKAARATMAAYPGLKIVGRRNGYFQQSEEAAIIEEIVALKPDVVWISLGVPLEQYFCARNLAALKGVAIVKTAGGLFDFISLSKPRAPKWMQRMGMEWLFRVGVEPKRLFFRYLITNPHALFLLATGMWQANA